MKSYLAKIEELDGKSEEACRTRDLKDRDQLREAGVVSHVFITQRRVLEAGVQKTRDDPVEVAIDLLKQAEMLFSSRSDESAAKWVSTARALLEYALGTQGFTWEEALQLSSSLPLEHQQAYCSQIRKIEKEVSEFVDEGCKRKRVRNPFE